MLGKREEAIKYLLNCCLWIFSTHINHSAAVLLFRIYSSAVFGGVRNIAALIWTLQAFWLCKLLQKYCVYLVLCTRDACKEDEVGYEEADAEVQMDCGSWALNGADQPKSQDADEETDQWKGQTHPSDQLQLKLVLLGGRRMCVGERNRVIWPMTMTYSMSKWFHHQPVLTFISWSAMRTAKLLRWLQEQTV